MTKRHNGYEAAFEAYLRSRQIPYVAVDETRRALDGGRSLKSLDFIVSPRGQPGAWLVDIKGRRFPSGQRTQQFWKNWSTDDELSSLSAWESHFGSNFHGLLVFAYQVIGDKAPLPADELFPFRGGLFGFVAIRLDHYASWSRPLSPKWGTVSMPAAPFRSLARSVSAYFGRGAEAA